MLLKLARAAQDRGWRRISRALFRLDLWKDGLGDFSRPDHDDDYGARLMNEGLPANVNEGRP